MTTDEPAIVPAEVLILIKNPPLLKGESKEDYYGLLAALARDVRPADLAEWLWLIELLNCVWEIFRNGQFRAKLIDMNRHQALGTVILKHMPDGPKISLRQLRVGMQVPVVLKIMKSTLRPYLQWRFLKPHAASRKSTRSRKGFSAGGTASCSNSKTVVRCLRIVRGGRSIWSAMSWICGQRSLSTQPRRMQIHPMTRR